MMRREFIKRNQNPIDLNGFVKEPNNTINNAFSTRFASLTSSSTSSTKTGAHKNNKFLHK
jgi:hypothetical protein